MSTGNATTVQHSLRQSSASKKQVYKTVQATSLEIQWPTIPLHASNQILAALLDLLKEVKGYRQTLKKPRRVIRRLPETTESHSITLRSGHVVQVPDWKDPLPSLKVDPSEPVSCPPDILPHLIVGINSVQSHLESFITETRAALMGLPSCSSPAQNLDSLPRNTSRKRKRTLSPSNIRKKRRLNLPSHSASFTYLMQQFPRQNKWAKDLYYVSKSRPTFTVPELLPNRVFPSVSASDSRTMYLRPSASLSAALVPVLERNDPSWFAKKRLQALRRWKCKSLRQRKKLKSKDVSSKRIDQAVPQKDAATVEKSRMRRMSKRKKQLTAVTQMGLQVEKDFPLLPAQISTKKIRVIIVCRGDIEPKSLVAHIPMTVCVANGLLHRSTLHTAADLIPTATNQAQTDTVQDDDKGIYLVQLAAGSEAKVADALGIRTAAVLALTTEAPIQELLSLIKQHTKPLTAPHFSSLAGIDAAGYQQTSIKHTQTLVPTNPRQVRQERKAEQKGRKAARSHPQSIRDTKALQKNEEAKIPI